jgi:hypothetical protein
MEEQPEALELADMLDLVHPLAIPFAGKAAAELRRLHGVNQQLLKAVKDSDKLIVQLMPGIKHIALQDYGFLNDTLIANTEAIKAGE